MNNLFKKPLFGFLFFLISLNQTHAQNIEGRWDLTVTRCEQKVPSWLEINHSGVKYLVGHFVADGGSSRPISRIFFNENKLTFSIPPQWDSIDKDLKVEGELKNDALSGTMTMPNGEVMTWVGVRAPKLIRTKEPVWGTPIKLFNGKNTEGWDTFGQPSQWVVENSVLKSPKSGANIRTTGKFNDFKLHVEFRVPKGSNSGVYLRGRYEVQITDSYGKEPALGELGAIYGFIQPLELPAKPAGEWQSFDVTLVGRVVTVTLNGKTIIYKNEIPGITGGAIDSNEAEAGPIMFQGDHGPIEYRNITLIPAK
ncbi:MAG: DUF1080 domain-containing protein [Cytophagaceae bacterium]|nr:DUF1080 domain-containing protein [Cytophagaceae bacterium]